MSETNINEIKHMSVLITMNHPKNGVQLASEKTHIIHLNQWTASNIIKMWLSNAVTNL